MANKKIIISGLLHAAGVLVYVTLVSLILRNGEKVFGKMEGFMAPVAFLMLFVFSALVTGLLILGRPMYLYFSQEKEKAAGLLISTAAWLFVLLVLVFGFMLLRRVM